MNTKIIISLIIHFLITLSILINEEMYVLGIISLVFFLCNILGIIIIKIGKIEAGTKIYMISCFFYVPIGLIGIWGARNILDEYHIKKFNEKIKS